MNCKWITIIITAIVVIIGIIVVVTCVVKVESSGNVISLEDNAFDDQYVGCEKTMEMRAKDLLAQERAINSNFSKVWKNAESKWENMSPKKKRMNMLFEVAIIAYTMEENKIYPTFNQAVRKCCYSSEDYMNNFHFKALHFYLTRAVQILRTSCTNVYRGISVGMHPDGTGEMRFGQFASTSLEEGAARKFINASGTLYKVYTCEGANIEHLSVFPDEKEVLIPPYEVFSVSRFLDSGGLKNVELHSKRTFSKFNCAYLRGKKNQNYLVTSGNINSMVLGKVTPRLFVGTQLLLLRILCLNSS
ncbi:ecto-ADP-ribosyltransferase 5-like [Petaurus breviceps papuanus]|uniref:ecto-ADP-ribosyltransferase 5-like n=1 Tax=Petaurus breviceps papuanus TaxID=3040969 RepID=UPI0036DA5E36